MIEVKNWIQKKPHELAFVGQQQIRCFYVLSLYQAPGQMTKAFFKDTGAKLCAWQHLSRPVKH